MDLQICSVCNCTQLQGKCFEINQKGKYKKTCNTCLERYRRYRERNRKKINDRFRRYRQANRDKINERKKLYRQAGKESDKPCTKPYRIDKEDISIECVEDFQAHIDNQFEKNTIWDAFATYREE